MLLEDEPERPHLRSVRTVLYMLVMSVTVAATVILFCYCRVHGLCHILSLHPARRLRLQWVHQHPRYTTKFSLCSPCDLREGFLKRETLFYSSRYNPHHVLYRLLPRIKDTGHGLRQRAHNLTLPSDVGSTARQNFIMRMLFTNMYWSVFTFQMLLCMFFVHIMYFPLFVML